LALGGDLLDLQAAVGRVGYQVSDRLIVVAGDHPEAST
jgi:hypothetical protein